MTQLLISPLCLAKGHCCTWWPLLSAFSHWLVTWTTLTCICALSSIFCGPLSIQLSMKLLSLDIICCTSYQLLASSSRVGLKCLHAAFVLLWFFIAQFDTSVVSLVVPSLGGLKPSLFCRCFGTLPPAFVHSSQFTSLSNKKRKARHFVITAIILEAMECTIMSSFFIPSPN